MKQIEILAGIKADVNSDGKQDIRLTPVHVPLALPDIVADILVSLATSADLTDDIPVNGEVDFDVSPEWLKKIPDLPVALIAGLSEKANVKAFVRIRYKRV